MPSTHAHPDFDRYRALLMAKGGALTDDPARHLDRDGDDELVYVPFHYVNVDAKLVIVGITPGPTQIRLAYNSVQRCLVAGLGDIETLVEAKRAAAFGGPLRRNLDRMLEHFGLPAFLGATGSADLWAAGSTALECTSVVPHAAFRAGKMFAGRFEEVLASHIFRNSFERDFVGSLDELGDEAMFVALGPTPLDALDWCVKRGAIRAGQVLGAFAHPSAGAGSQVDVYLGIKDVADLDAKDPVRRRTAGLRRAYDRMEAATAALRESTTTASRDPSPSGNSGTLSQPPAVVAAEGSKTIRIAPRPPSEGSQASRTAGAGASPVDGIHAFVSRGRNKGMLLRPHLQDGCFIVSQTRFEEDYKRVPHSEPLIPYLEAGYRLRMSGKGHAPSLFSSASILGWRG